MDFFIGHQHQQVEATAVKYCFYPEPVGTSNQTSYFIRFRVVRAMKDSIINRDLQQSIAT